MVLGVTGNNRRGRERVLGFRMGSWPGRGIWILAQCMRKLMSAMGKDWLDHDGDDHLLLPLSYMLRHLLVF